MVTERNEIYKWERTQQTWKEYSGVTCEKIETYTCDVGCDLYCIQYHTVSL